MKHLIIYLFHFYRGFTTLGYAPRHDNRIAWLGALEGSHLRVRMDQPLFCRACGGTIVQQPRTRLPRIGAIDPNIGVMCKVCAEKRHQQLGDRALGTVEET